jgi:hypothetical protein
MYAVLPRELRDQVYQHLLDIEPVQTRKIHDDMAEIFGNGDASYDPDFGPEPYAPDHEDIYFIQAAYVGENFRKEIIERLYYDHFRVLSLSSIKALHGLLVLDPLGTGLCGLDFVRTLRLYWESFFHYGSPTDPAYIRSSPLPSWKTCLGALLSVKNKATFEFTMEINFGHFNLCWFVHLLETFRPVYANLIAAGSKIIFRHYSMMHKYDFDLAGYYEKPFQQGLSDVVREFRNLGQQWKPYGIREYVRCLGNVDAGERVLKQDDEKVLLAEAEAQNNIVRAFSCVN